MTSEHYRASIMDKEPNPSELIAALERTVEEQKVHIQHLEELHRMQALPPFFMNYIVDFDGPKLLTVSPRILGEPRCMMCGELMHDGDEGLEIRTRHVREMNDNIFVTRTALIHSTCYSIASAIRTSYGEEHSTGSKQGPGDSV
jgi:hypothetical protein